MQKIKRKPFFIKGNFQIGFIAAFILLLFIEVMLAGLFIYKLSARKIEAAVFSSHISIDSSLQIIKPIILRVNIYFVLISIFLACLTLIFTHFRLHNLFSKIIKGIERLKCNNTSLRIKPSGGKKARELIEEFNQAAAYLDKRLNGLRSVLDSILKEDELKPLKELHEKLYSIIAGRD